MSADSRLLFQRGKGRCVISNIFELSPIFAGAKGNEAEALVSWNDTTKNYGLVLSPEQAMEIADEHSRSMHSYGFVELGAGIAEKIIRAFYTSPYISQNNYVETVCALIGMFYALKEDFDGTLSDDEIIRVMRQSFNGECGGDVEQLHFTLGDFAEGKLRAMEEAKQRVEQARQSEEEFAALRPPKYYTGNADYDKGVFNDEQPEQPHEDGRFAELSSMVDVSSGDCGIALPGTVDCGMLTAGRYFESLMTAALACGVITQEQLLSIQTQVLEKYDEKRFDRTRGASAAVTEQMASGLMQDVMFTLGVWLKTFESPDDAVRSLLANGVKKCYLAGYEQLKKQVRIAELQYGLLTRRLFPLDNSFYRRMFAVELKKFFAEYDPWNDAHSTVGDVTYDLMSMPDELQGVEFVSEYIIRASAENEFVSIFDRAAVHTAFDRYAQCCLMAAMPGVTDVGANVSAGVNLFEAALVTAIICEAGGDSMFSLDPSVAGARKYLEIQPGSLGEMRRYFERVLERAQKRTTFNTAALDYFRRAFDSDASLPFAAKALADTILSLNC